MRKIIFILAVLALVLAGCGRKEPPQTIADAPAPELSMFKHVVQGRGLFLTIKITGGSRGVGYQLDRSELDPGCKCPSFWRRFFEEAPSSNLFNKEISKVLHLGSREHAYRARAIDALGRFSEWSAPFMAKAEKAPK